MSKVSLSITMSLDCSIRCADASEDLYEGSCDASELLEESIRDTGSVLMGRDAFEMSGNPDWYARDRRFASPAR
jgi:hypothetical protein